MVQRILQFIQYYSQWMPFRVNFYIYILCFWGIYHITQAMQSDTNSFIALTLLLAKIAMWFSLTLVILALLSVLLSAFYFLYFKKKYNKEAFQVEMNSQTLHKGNMIIHTRMPYAIRPMLGFVYMRLFYLPKQYTDKYLLTGKIKKQWISFRSGIEGQNECVLPLVKEYHFTGALVYFQDMLKMFSIPIKVDYPYKLINLPQTLSQTENTYSPKKTDEELMRIEELRRIEGEYLQYKKFDNSDDVRRIVWKIFAKNKELVVRTPEIMNPFASHIYVYASFFSIENVQSENIYTDIMLHHFKNNVWTVYNTLVQKELSVKWIADQYINTGNTTHDQVQHQIALCNWHNDKKLHEYIKPAYASIVLLHSLSNEEDVSALLQQSEQNTHIIFVKCSKVFRSNYILHWLSRLFLLPPQDEWRILKSKWILQPIRWRVIQNENKLIKLLKQSDKEVIYI